MIRYMVPLRGLTRVQMTAQSRLGRRHQSDQTRTTHEVPEFTGNPVSPQVRHGIDLEYCQNRATAKPEVSGLSTCCARRENTLRVQFNCGGCNI